MNKTKYRIKIVSSGSRQVIAYKTVAVSDTDELRGEIENFCMELEKSYPCAVRCESADRIDEREDKTT